MGTLRCVFSDGWAKIVLEEDVFRGLELHESRKRHDGLSYAICQLMIAPKIHDVCPHSRVDRVSLNLKT